MGRFPVPVVAWRPHVRKPGFPAEALAHRMIDWHAHCTEVLGSVNPEMGFAEGHGVLCGRICSGREVDLALWMEEVLGGEAEGDLERCRQVLQVVSEETLAQLASPECVFCPFLPNDDQPLAWRCAELVRWCEGFLYGLGASGVSDWSVLGDDACEVLADLTAFTRLRAGRPSSEAERDYCDLVEYLRVGVMLLNEQFAAPLPRVAHS